MRESTKEPSQYKQGIYKELAWVLYDGIKAEPLLFVASNQVYKQEIVGSALHTFVHQSDGKILPLYFLYMIQVKHMKWQVACWIRGEKWEQIYTYR